MVYVCAVVLSVGPVTVIGMSLSDDTSKLEEIAAAALERAKAHGADAADAIIVESVATSATCRMGALEDIERSEERDLGLRVFVGRRQASVSSSDFSPDRLDRLAERAVDMARAVPEDRYAGLAAADELASGFPDLDLYDGQAIDADTLLAMAGESEAAALEVEGISNSLGASASAGAGGMVLATTNGFTGGYRSSSYSVSCSVVAGEGTAMERDYEFSRRLHFEDLMAPAEISRTAAQRTIRRLNPRKIASQSLPAVYDPRVAGGLLGHFASAVSGAAIARGTSFLKHSLGRKVFADGIYIVDDPHRARGLRSRPFDGEGVANGQLELVADGILTQWLLDTGTARQLGLKTNGRASREIGGPPSPSATNLHLAPGAASRGKLIGSIDRGVYITDLIGMGVSLVTGDYSQGAAGFMIEDGELADPVSEITIAGNLKDMYANLTPASDLEFRYGVNAPTILIEGMTVAGS